MDAKKTGTTTVGIVCADCVILGAESKSTLGFLVSSKEAQKVYQINSNIAVTIAGSTGDAQTIIRMLKAEINLYKMTRNAEMSLKAVATLLSNLLQNMRYYPYMIMLIIGGVDKTGGHIYSVDAIGGAEEDKYTSTGSGSPLAYGVLEDGFREGMKREDGIRLAVRAIRSARERDIFSGGRDINIAVIDKTGFELVSADKIKEIAK